MSHFAVQNEAVIARLLDAQMHGLDAARNPHLWWCSSAQTLLDERFVFEKDDEDGEADEHYSVILGNPPTLEDAKRFVQAFTKEEEGRTMTEIMIDPNVRVSGGLTFSGFEDVRGPMLSQRPASSGARA